MPVAQEFLSLVQQQREQLDQAAGELIQLANHLALARTVDHALASDKLRRAVELSASVRQLVMERACSCGLDLHEWIDADGLDVTVAAISNRLRDQPRGRLRSLAEELERGGTTHRRASRQRELDRLRERAGQNLRHASEREVPPILAGPADGKGRWLDWWWQQDGPGQEQILATLTEVLPDLASFLDQLEQTSWQAERVTPAPAPVAPAVSPSSVVVESPPAILAPEPAPAPPPPEPVPAPPAPLVEPEGAARPIDPIAAEPVQARPEKKKPRGNLQPTPVAGSEPAGSAPTAPTVRIPAPSPSPPAVKKPEIAEDSTPLPAVSRTLPPELQTFEAFRASHWLAPTGHCDPAPWADREAFLARLRQTSDGALARHQFHHVYLLARSIEHLDAARLTPRPADIRALASIWSHPLDAAAGLDEERGAFIQQAGDIEPGPRWRLALFLEAIRPSSNRFQLSLEDTDTLVDEVAYLNGTLAGVVRGLLHASVLGIDPMPRLRETYRAEALESVEVLQKRLAARRNDLQLQVKALWKAAGGAIQRTHCREAWDEFITYVKPAIEDLYPEDRNGKADWDVEKMRKHIGTFYAEHTRIADDRGVKFQDRSAADRSARKIAEVAAGVNEVMEQIHRASGRRASSVKLALPLDGVRTLEKQGPLADPLEECCRQLLFRHLQDLPEGEPAHDLLEVTVRDLLEHPEWLALLEPGSSLDPDRGRKPPHTLFHINDLKDPIQAAAVLLMPAAILPGAEGGDPFDRLIDRLQQHPNRELLGRVVGLVGPSREQGQVHATRGDRVDQMRSALAQLHDLIQTLDALVGDVDLLRLAEDEAARLLDEAVTGSEELGLLEHWLKRLCRHVELRREHELRHLRAQAREETDPERREAILDAINRRSYTLILPLLRGQTNVAPARFRETCWRHEVESRFGKPDRAGRKIKQLDEEVAQTWKPISGEPTRADRPVRTSFARYVFPEEPYTARGSTPGAGGESLYRLAENEAHFFALETRHVRRYIAQTDRNPCFVPQLARFTKLVLLTPPVPPGDRNFKEKMRNVLAQHRRDLCIVLIPQLSSQLRRDTQVWFREVNAVVLDDYDLCRLLTPDARDHRPDPLLGLLEIAFEQLRWKDFSPFVADDGQRVPLEIFVGRVEEADMVAQTGQISRLFSGRKLGKSALLRFIREKYDNAKLPSGYRLRVLYVPAVGVEDEAAMVGSVLTSLRDCLAFEANGVHVSSPGDRLVAALAQYRKERPDESLLIILDEADIFVEEQLRQYVRVKEKCLSFKIRGQVTSETDVHGLPRVRVLYSGYRATHTREGAWGGSGSDVHFLAPLPIEEAVKLIAGPLARLGIDASQEALPIAHRCGCQPIVLLRFGECLLQRLDQIHPPASRDRAPIRVTPEDVAFVFNETRVQDEIWSVTRGNFQGNERGFVVFAALLLEYASRSPGVMLEDAEQLVLDRVRQLDGDLRWLVPEGDDALGVIATHLRDFVDRKLLVTRERSGRRQYALTCPHHLPVLMRKNPEREAQASLRQLREGGGQEPPRTLLPPSQIQDLQSALFQPTRSPVRAGVVASMWQDAIEDQTHGLPIWLGILHVAPDAVVSARDPRLETRLGGPHLLITSAGPDLANRVLLNREEGLPPPVMVGGTDLLRWALCVQKQRPGSRGTQILGALLAKDPNGEPAPPQMLEIATVCRLPLPVLRGWFNRVRAFEFDHPDALLQIAQRTSGIPMLVGIVDRLLQGWDRSAGKTISIRDFEDALTRFDEERQVAAEMLSGDDPGLRLQKRERQILHMIATVCRENNYDVADLASELVFNWELYQESCPVPALDPNPAGNDLLALDLVQQLGLVPIDHEKPAGRPLERLVPIGREDALWGLVEQMRPLRKDEG